MRTYGTKALKGKKALITIIAAVLIIALAAAAYYIFSRKSARELYLEAEGRNFMKYADLIKSQYAEYKESRKPYLTGNHRTRTEITLSQGDTGNMSDKKINGIMDIAGKCKLIVDQRNNPQENTNMTQLSLLLEKTPFLDAEVFLRDRQLYFTVPVFTPGRYFTLNTERLKEVYDRFGIPMKPLRVPGLAAAADAIELDTVKFDNMLSEFGGFIAKSIKEEDVKFGDTVDRTISGQQAKGREVSVNLSGPAITALLKALAAKAGGDNVFADLTYGNFAAVSEIVDETGLFRLFDYLEAIGTLALNDTEKDLLKALSVKKDVEGFKKKLSEMFKDCEFKDGIKMDLVIDNAGNIIDRKANLSVKNTSSGMEYQITIVTGTNSLKYNDYRNRFLEFEVGSKTPEGENDRQYFRFIPSLEPAAKDKGNKGKLEFAWGIDADNGLHSSTSVKLDIDASTDELTARDNTTVGYVIRMEGSNEGQPENIDGELKIARWKNNKLKTRNQTTSFTINADMPDFGITDFTAQLNLAQEDTLETEAFQLPDAANAIDLYTATDEELDRVWEDILGSFGTFYLTNKPIVDAVLGE